jgi:hypothetical protein
VGTGGKTRLKIGAKAVSDRRDVISGMPECGAGINILIDLD